MNLRDEDLIEFVEENKVKNTIKKTCSDMNAWKRWCESIGELRNMEDIPTAELSSLLGHFAMKVRKQNGEEYEPNSITVFFRSFDRYLKDKGQTRSIMLDREFEGSRRVLEAKRKDLRKQGIGTKQKAAEVLSVDEEEKLWSTKQLGDHSPHSLLHC